MNSDFFHAWHLQSSSPVVNARAIQLPINPELKFHRVYFYLEGYLTPGTGDFLFEGELVWYRQGRVVGRMPASIARDNAGTNLKEPVPSCFTSTTLIAADVLKVDLNAKLGTAGKTQAILIPSHIQCEADLVVWELKTIKAWGGETINGVRAYLAIRSHGQPT